MSLWQIAGIQVKATLSADLSTWSQDPGYVAADVTGLEEGQLDCSVTSGQPFKSLLGECLMDEPAPETLPALAGASRRAHSYDAQGILFHADLGD